MAGSSGFFGDISKIEFEGADSTNPLAFHHYNPDELLNGKRMEDHLRFAVCYWHNFVWPGGDPVGGQTFDRDWFPADTLDLAKRKADVAFDMFSLLGIVCDMHCAHPHCVRRLQIAGIILEHGGFGWRYAVL